MNNERGTTPDAPIVDSAAGLSRRRLLRGGLGASPVLLTLASRPVNAATCTLASSFVSVATFKSRNPGTSAQCANYTCEWWKSECTSGTTHKAFMDATSVTTFLGSTFPGSIYATRSLSSIMKDVAGIQLNTELGVLQHLIALGMNLKGNYATAGNLSQLYINGVWSNYKTNLNTYKLPSSGINWDSAALVTWARMLMYPSL